jgi:hypothetical protein
MNVRTRGVISKYSTREFHLMFPRQCFLLPRKHSPDDHPNQTYHRTHTFPNHRTLFSLTTPQSHLNSKYRIVLCIPFFHFLFPPPPPGSPHNMNIQHLSCFSTEFNQVFTQIYIHFHIYYLNAMVKVMVCVRVWILLFLPDPLTPDSGDAARRRYAVRTRIYMPGRPPQ